MLTSLSTEEEITILYELLVPVLPFEEETTQTASEHMSDKEPRVFQSVSCFFFFFNFSSRAYRPEHPKMAERPL